MCFVFFFQAEDGIRDIGVTGVQTCALPISTRWSRTTGRTWRSATPTASSTATWTSSCARSSCGGLTEAEGRHEDRKSVVEGKSVDLGGRRIIKKKKK